MKGSRGNFSLTYEVCACEAVWQSGRSRGPSADAAGRSAGPAGFSGCEAVEEIRQSLICD